LELLVLDGRWLRVVVAVIDEKMVDAFTKINTVKSDS
jgi:hypothetical protein